MIVKSALLLFRGTWPANRILLVREEGKNCWLFPGGKQEIGETIEEALLREIREELSVDAVDFKSIGSVDGAPPDGKPLRIHLFSGGVDGEVKPSQEIVAVRWVMRSELPSIAADLTPITSEKVFPLLLERSLW